MHKKLESDLISLAHRILKMKNKEDVFALKEISKEVYDKLSMLAFVEEYINTTPHLETSKEDLLEKVNKAFETKEQAEANVVKEEKQELKVVKEEIEIKKETKEEKVVYDLIEDKVEISAEVIEEVEEQKAPVLNLVDENEDEIIEQPFDELQELMFPAEPENNFKNDPKDIGDQKTHSLEDELQDTIPVDVMADLFENAQPKSLNDTLLSNIQIDLNDRITFVKNLFEGDQENYNRVISQLNTFKTFKEAKKFINKMVKSDYNWSEHEELESRFMDIVSRKFD